MTKNDLLKRLAPMDDDKVIILIHPDGGWSNFPDIIVEDECVIKMYEEKFEGIFTSDRT